MKITQGALLVKTERTRAAQRTLPFSDKTLVWGKGVGANAVLTDKQTEMAMPLALLETHSVNILKNFKGF